MAFWNRDSRRTTLGQDSAALIPDSVGTSIPKDDAPQEYGHELITAASVTSEARAPFIPLSGTTQAAFIDQRVFSAMVAADRVLEQNGDLYDGIAAATEYYSDGVIITCKDAGAQKAYREFAKRINLDFWLQDSHGTTGIMGNSYLAFAGSGDDCMVYAMNPKLVAVGSQIRFGQRPVAYVGGNSTALYQELFQQGVATVGENEWPEFGIEKNSSGVLIDPTRVYHRYVFKPSYKRYGLPPAIRAWDQIADRMTVGKMIRATASGIKTQVRVWKVKSSRLDAVAKLTAEINAMKAMRSYDLVTSLDVDVDQIMPKTVSELLADDTWMSMTDRCFRSMGLSLVLASGERMSGNSGGAQSGDGDTQLMVAINRLKSEMNTNLRMAAWILGMYATHGNPALAKKPPVRVYYRETLLGMDQRVRAVVPLLNYGAISIRSVHEYLGMDSEIEMGRLREELPLRKEGIIQPYAGFGQVANGNTTNSPASPGRPLGPDTDTGNRETNRQNALSTNGRH